MLKANELLHEKKKINVEPILKYFKSTWMDGKYKKDFGIILIILEKKKQ